MIDICQELSSDIIESELFNKEYKKLCLNLAIEQIKNVGSFIPISIDKCNLQYLLKCANIFSQTNNNILKEKALRIAQFSFEHGNVTEKEYAYILVSTLTNKPSINLAKKNQLLDNNIEYYLPLNLTLQRLERENIAFVKRIACKCIYLDAIGDYTLPRSKETILCNLLNITLLIGENER